MPKSRSLIDRFVAVLEDGDVARLEVAMNDAGLVRRFERAADGFQHGERVGGREAPPELHQLA